MPGKRFLLSLFAVSALCLADAGAGDNLSARRDEAWTLRQKGNFLDASVLFRQLALDPANDPHAAAADIDNAAQTLSRVRPEEVEPFLTAAAEAWKGHWRPLDAVAAALVKLPAMANPAGGLYTRSNRWVNNAVSAAERDRVRAIRLRLAAEKLFDEYADPASPADRRRFYTAFAALVMKDRADGLAWRLAGLTALDPVPDYEDWDAANSRRHLPAPVDADGNPLYHRMPASWEAAKTDGERWRWLLGRIAASDGERGRQDADMILARFLVSQFGVQTFGETLAFRRNDAVAEGDGETGPFAVRTLGDDETIARLASGVKRFTLPDEFNYIKLFASLANHSAFGQMNEAAKQLAQIYQNRQQYPKAVSYWRKAALASPQKTDKASHEAAERIVANVGTLEAGLTRPAGTRFTLPYLFRNGSSVTLTAQRLDDKQLFQDIHDALKSGPEDEERSRLLSGGPEAVGNLAIRDNGAKYIRETVAQWEVKLDPLPDHFSKRQYIEMPFEQAGAYLVTAEMANGNTSRVVIWLADLALVKKQSYNREIIFVADAVTGEPVSGADIGFYGYSREYRENERRPTIEAKAFLERSDADGLAVIDADRMKDANWLIVAGTADGRFAYLGFEPVWIQPMPDDYLGDLAAFIITDRPVYRPDQRVNLKVWLGQPSYSRQASDNIARRQVDLVVTNPMGETVFEKTLVTDSYGGAADSLTLDASAPLGHYNVFARWSGTMRNGREETQQTGGYTGFRLEEYKKPEFEVKVDAPEETLALGDVAAIKVSADYYFGAPVANAAVSYRVLRTAQDDVWFPPRPWDWLYGKGSWWTGYDYDWLPGWSNWGMNRPSPAWLPRPYFGPPELVAEGEGALDADGVFRLSVDTSAAKALYGDTDHRYEITVEVTDQSRRTIVGTGSLIAARQPFSVKVWSDCGYYEAGRDMTASVRAVSPMGSGVKASGKAVLHRIKYNADGVSSETEIFSQDIATDADGSARVRLSAAAPGQYRLSCRLKDADGREIEGAAVLAVRGDKGEGDFRYAALELVPDKLEYHPGETLKLAVNSENKKAIVLFFPRAERNGEKTPAKAAAATGRPQLLRLADGDGIVPIDVGIADQPNFFCEAITIANGQIHTEIREILVPPANKALTVEVKPDAESYRPGDKATFTVKTTGTDGWPVAAQCVVTLYDQAVEYISGGSNVGDIRAAFWSWKRHYPAAGSASCNLNRRGHGVYKEGDASWQPIGVFGRLEADWNDDMLPQTRSRAGGRTAITGYGASNSAMMVAESAVAMDGAMPPLPAPAAPMMAKAEMAVATGGAAAAPMAETTVRSEFADTALWIAALDTDDDGLATFSLDMPENLTAWKARAWAMGDGARVGEGNARVETKKNVIIRPQAPRFLTQKDEVVLTANLHNYFPRAKQAKAVLVLEGGILEASGRTPTTQTVELPANGEAKAEWIAYARRPGTARIVMKLLTDEESDAAEVAVPVIVHGARRVETFNSILRPEEKEKTLSFRVPDKLMPDESVFELSFSPSIASAMIDALPYLIHYPYGCTEQTLNRFLPTVMTWKYLERLGVSLKAEGDAATPDAKAAAWLKRFGDPRGIARKEGVFTEAELAAMVKEGIERLSGMQNADGGWGWFSGSGERSWPHTTALVVHGLLAARENGVAIPSDVLDKGVAWLRAHQTAEIEELKKHLAASGEKGKAEADSIDAFIYMTLAKQGYFNPDMRDFLYRDRLHLPLSSLAMLGIALHAEKAGNFLETVAGNLAQYVDRDAENRTAWLRLPGDGWWRWYNDEVETQAWYLKFLTRFDPRGDDTAGLAKYLLQNRKNGSYWRSTRDSALAIEALTEFAVASGEISPNMTVELQLDGAIVMQREVKAVDDTRFILKGLAVEPGDHTLRIVKSGNGNLYFSGKLEVFTLADPIAKAGGDLKVERTFRTIRSSGQAKRASGPQMRRHIRPIALAPEPAYNLRVDPGDLVEVELTIDAKNDYEYLVFEDMKAAGLEAVELRSGYAADSLGAYVEYRDQKVTLFIRSLPRGKHMLTYRFRAETPGYFSALPVSGGGMYAPELAANSDEMKIHVTDEAVYGD